MNKNVVIIVSGIVLVFAIIAVTLVLITDHDGTLLIGFLASAILPTVASLFAYNSAEQAKKNTNGLLHSTLERAVNAERKLAQATNENTN